MLVSLINNALLLYNVILLLLLVLNLKEIINVIIATVLLLVVKDRFNYCQWNQQWRVFLNEENRFSSLIEEVVV